MTDNPQEQPSSISVQVSTQSASIVIPEESTKVIMVRVPGIQGPPAEVDTTNYQLIYELARG